MKKLILIFSAILVLASCQKKEYASFQKSNPSTYAVSKKQVVVTQPTTAATILEEVPAAIETTTSANIDNDLMTSNFGEKSLKTNNSGILSEKEINSVLSQKSEIKETEISVVNKKRYKKLGVTKAMLIKKLNANVKKSTKVNSVEGRINTLSLISLILGSLGLILMFTGVGGILFGIAGFITGLIALKRDTPNRTMAILGVVFGGIAVLIALLVITLLAALFAAVL